VDGTLLVVYVPDLDNEIHTLSTAGGSTTLRCVFPFSSLMTGPMR
jgi:hypothetical protein